MNNTINLNPLIKELHIELRSRIRHFAENEIAPLAKELDEEAIRRDRDAYDNCQELGGCKWELQDPNAFYGDFPWELCSRCGTSRNYNPGL